MDIKNRRPQNTCLTVFVFIMKNLYTILLLSIFNASLLCAQDVYHINGKVYSNVSNLKNLDGFFSFDYEGKSYSFPEYKIKRIRGRDGRNIYERAILEAVKEREDPRSPNYIFLKNNLEIARGKWLTAGQFLITEGDPGSGIYREYFDSGELRRTFSFQDGSLNGVCKVFYRSGKEERKGHFKNGREIGRSELFYPDGKLKGWSEYQDGLKNGPTKLYYPNQQIKAELNFKDGIPVGEQIMFYENGNVESKSCYDENGIKNGPVTFYYESGKLKEQGIFVNGVLHGTVTTYYESGRVKKRKEFVNGRVIQQ